MTTPSRTLSPSIAPPLFAGPVGPSPLFRGRAGTQATPEELAPGRPPRADARADASAVPPVPANGHEVGEAEPSGNRVTTYSVRKLLQAPPPAIGETIDRTG